MTNWVFAVWVTGLGVWFVGSLLADRKRAQLMGALASRLGFNLWGKQLSRELSLTGIPMAAASSRDVLLPILLHEMLCD